MNTKTVGNYGEQITILKFCELNIPVFTSVGDNERCDLIAEFNGKLNKIQCKTSLHKIDNNTFVAKVISKSTKNGKEIYHHYDSTEVDYFSIYNIELNQLLLVPQNVIGNKSTITFRIKSPKNGQEKGINYCSDYTFEKITNSNISLIDISKLED